MADHTKPRGSAAAATRSRVLDAAALLMSTVGIARTTTKEIARAADCSEATLYKYFRDKEDLFVHVLHERSPRLSGMLQELPSRAGEGEVLAHLTEVALIALPFYRRAFPMAISLFASPDLVAAHRRNLDLPAVGPQKPTEWLTAYLLAEQKLGRIPPGAHPAAIATLLIGACFHRAFLSVFLADDTPDATLSPDHDEQFAQETAETLLNGLHPR